ncbi:MAG TPA: xylulokinase [Firmicutes bacterium]|nr:xylulokinase [Bacillota bacterium]
MKEAYIGVDLGTSAVKLLLVGPDGRILNETQEEYPVYYPHSGWSEQNPADWTAAVARGMKKLLAGADASAVKGISFGGQMHGLVILDERGEVIRPAILWNDGRTAEETEYLNTVIGKEKLSRLTANIAFAGFTAPKLLWVRKHEPENFARISKIMLPKDYLAYRMTGVHCTDLSDASGMLLLDVERGVWSKEMCEICGVTEAQLPRLYNSYEVVGTLTEEAAAELGLPAGVRVIAGAGDNAAAAVGTGTVGDGACNISLGTSGTVFISSDTFGVDKANALHSFRHADGGYHLMGCILSAASCNKWWVEDILRSEHGVEQAAMPGRLGRNEVYFLPYMMGERSPHNDVDARSMFVGMRPDTTRADMGLAVMEGVTFALRDCLEVAKSNGVKVTRTRICGGGARSELWRKIVAGALGIPVDTVTTEKGPAYGAALLAMVGCGRYATVREACDACVSVRATVMPDPVLVEAYGKMYNVYKAIYPAMKDVFKLMK